MSESAKDRIRRFREQGMLLRQQAIEEQIREGIPTIFATAGYPEGTYTISSFGRVKLEGSDVMELKIKLTGSEEKMANLKKGLEMSLHPVVVELQDDILIIKKEL